MSAIVASPDSSPSAELATVRLADCTDGQNHMQRDVGTRQTSLMATFSARTETWDSDGSPRQRFSELNNQSCNSGQLKVPTSRCVRFRTLVSEYAISERSSVSSSCTRPSLEEGPAFASIRKSRVPPRGTLQLKAVCEQPRRSSSADDLAYLKENLHRGSVGSFGSDVSSVFGAHQSEDAGIVESMVPMRRAQVARFNSDSSDLLGCFRASSASEPGGEYAVSPTRSIEQDLLHSGMLDLRFSGMSRTSSTFSSAAIEPAQGSGRRARVVRLRSDLSDTCEARSVRLESGSLTTSPRHSLAHQLEMDITACHNTATLGEPGGEGGAGLPAPATRGLSDATTVDTVAHRFHLRQALQSLPGTTQDSPASAAEASLAGSVGPEYSGTGVEFDATGRWISDTDAAADDDARLMDSLDSNRLTPSSRTQRVDGVQGNSIWSRFTCFREPCCAHRERDTDGHPRFTPHRR